MEENKIKEYPQIRYHITYDENLTFKDLEDLLKLIRLSNNDVLQEMGISRAKGNDLQRIEKVESGSIDFVTALGVISSVVGIVDFAWNIIKYINERKQAEREKDLNGTKKYKKLYYRNEITVGDSKITNIDSPSIYTINIHIHNKGDINEIL